MQVRPLLVDRIREVQTQDGKLEDIKKKVQKGELLEFAIRDDGMLMCGQWLCVPADVKLKK